MLPLTLYLKNFKGHRETLIDFTQFESALILGQYANNPRKSNAAGKSTILDGIRWIIFDETDVKINKIVRRGQEVCEGYLEFEQDNQKWRIERKRSKKSNKTQVILKSWNGTDWTKLDNRTSAQTEESIRSLIKLSHKTFQNSVLFSQNSFSEIAEATATDRKKIFKEPLSLAIYSKYEKSAKTKLVDIEKEFSNKKIMVYSIGDPEEDLKTIDSNITNIKNQLKQLESDRNTAKSNIVSLRAEYSSLEKLLSSDESKITETLSSLNVQKKKIDNNIEKLKQQASQYQESIISGNNQLKELEKQFNKLKEEQEKLIEKKIREDSEIIKELVEVEDKITKGNIYVARIQVDYDKWRKELPHGAECEVCFNELTDEYREKISKENKDKAEKAKVELDSAKKKLSALNKKKQELNSERSSSLDHKHLIKKMELSISSAQEKEKSIKGNISSIENNAVKLLESAQEEQNKLIDINKQIKDLEKKAKEFNFADICNKAQELKNNISKEEDKENKIVLALSAASTQLGISEEKKRKRTEDAGKLEELNAQLTVLEEDLVLWKHVVKAFGNNGIPSLIINTILDNLQIEANKILQDFRPELSLKFIIEKDEKDTLELVYYDNGVELEYNELSGGQKAYVSFALRLGLSIILQKSLGVNLRMLALDEIDQPLDEEGKDAFVDIVKKYQKKYKILVITHDDRLKSKFNHAIVVEKDRNGAVGKVEAL